MKKLLLLFISISLFSCASRKVDKSITRIEKEVAIEQVKETTEVSKTTENKTTETKTDNQNDIVFEDLEIVPLLVTEPIIVTTPDGKVTKYQNAKISHKKTTDKSKVKTNVKALESKATILAKNSKEKAKVLAKQKASVSIKKVEKTGWSWWWLLWIFIIVIVLRIIWVKYKEKIWFV